MKFSFPITKTEKTEDGRLLIEGVATSEALDCQGDILDFEGSKRAFAKWRGNVREQHDPKKAVGKALEVTYDDAAKSISVSAFISAGAKDTQEKVLDGTLAMFSVGGGAPTKTKLEKVGGKSVRRVLDWPMTELSLVDVGANPDAAVSVLKAAGMEDEEEPEKAAKEGPAGSQKAEEEEGEGKPAPDEEEAPEGEEPPPAPAPKPELTEAQMVEIVTRVTDAVMAAIAAKSKEDPAQPPAEPLAEKAVGEPALKKDEEADVLCAASILDSLKNLRVAEGSEPEIETKQLAALARASAALAEFIALEAGEVIMNAESPAPEPMIELAAKIDGLTKMLEASIQKSAPPPDPRIDDVIAEVGSISKATSELKVGVTNHDGEFKALRKGMDQILSMPVPGRAPLRMISPEMTKAVSQPTTNEANALRKAAQGAPHAVRDYLMNEAAALERG